MKPVDQQKTTKMLKIKYQTLSHKTVKCTFSQSGIELTNFSGDWQWWHRLM
jgi:hypothetical protein